MMLRTVLMVLAYLPIAAQSWNAFAAADQRSQVEKELSELDAKAQAALSECDKFESQWKTLPKTTWEGEEIPASRADLMKWVQVLKQAPRTPQASFKIYETFLNHVPSDAGWNLSPLLTRKSCSPVILFLAFKAAIRGAEKYRLSQKQREGIGALLVSYLRAEVSGRTPLTGLLAGASLLKLGIGAKLIPVSDPVYFEVGRLELQGRELKSKVTKEAPTVSASLDEANLSHLSEKEWIQMNQWLRGEMNLIEGYRLSISWLLERIPLTTNIGWSKARGFNGS
jgi:hypothetical protein